MKKRKASQREADKAKEMAKAAMDKAEADRKKREALIRPEETFPDDVTPSPAPEGFAQAVVDRVRAEEGKEPKADQLNIRVTKTLLAELRTLARKHGVSVAAIVEAGCRHQIEKLRSRPAPPPL